MPEPLFGKTAIVPNLIYSRLQDFGDANDPIASAAGLSASVDALRPAIAFDLFGNVGGPMPINQIGQAFEKAFNVNRFFEVFGADFVNFVLNEITRVVRNKDNR